MRSKLQASAGFTLLELTVVVAIIVALAAVVIPMVGSARRDGKVAEVLQIVDTLRSATHRYYSDTGAIPEERGDSTDSSKHELSLSQPSVANWNGPYIDHPLTRGDNPFGGSVDVYDSLDAAFQAGFKLTGGAKDASGPGCFVRFTGFPEEMAAAIDAELDKNVQGDWKQTGRVQWNASNLDVFLLDPDGQ